MPGTDARPSDPVSVRPTLWANGTPIALEPTGNLAPRDEPRRRPSGSLHRRRRLSDVRMASRQRRSEVRCRDPRVLPDDQPLPPSHPLPEWWPVGRRCTASNRRTPSGSISATNARARSFRGRFRSVLVASDEQLVQLIRYIHRNPLSFLSLPELGAYRWSSLGAYLGLGGLLVGSASRRCSRCSPTMSIGSGRTSRAVSPGTASRLDTSTDVTARCPPTTSTQRSRQRHRLRWIVFGTVVGVCGTTLAFLPSPCRWNFGSLRPLRSRSAINWVGHRAPGTWRARVERSAAHDEAFQSLRSRVLRRLDAG